MKGKGKIGKKGWKRRKGEDVERGDEKESRECVRKNGNERGRKNKRDEKE